MTVSLGSINRTNTKNTPGYSELYAAYEKDIASIPAATAMDVASAITMQNTAVFNKIEFDAESGCFSTSQEQDGEGQYGQIRTMVEGFIAGDNASLKAQIDPYIGVPCVFLARRKSDGVLEILGEKGLGIVLKFSKNDQGRAGGQMGYAFTGNQDYNHLPYDYSDGTIAE